MTGREEDIAGYTVRRRTSADDAAWLHLRQTLWPDCTAEMQAVEMKEYDSDPDRMAVFLAVDEEGAIVGFAEVSVRGRVDGSISPEVGYLEGWYVDGDHRGRGIGKALVAAGEEWTRGKGLTEFASDAELGNEQSIAAHKQLGFRETFRLVHFIKKLDG